MGNAEGLVGLTGLAKTYRKGSQEVRALRGVDLGIERGEMLAIMGPSGSGKSTLMHLLGCMDQPSAGSYRLDGREIAGLGDDELSRVRNQKIGFVFQDFNLLPRYTALENVCLPLSYAGQSRGAVEKGRLALERVGLGDRASHLPSELSGGQQQRAAIARSLVLNPSLLLADEPTGNLDTASSQAIMAIFQRLNDEGATVVMVTHEPDIAAYCKRMIILRDGSIKEDRKVESRAIA